MERIDNGSQSSAIDLTTADRDVVTVAAPIEGTKLYLVILMISSLSTSNALTVKEVTGSFTFNNDPITSGQTVSVIEIDLVKTAGDASTVIRLRDTVSTAATWTYAVYDVTPTAAGGGTGFTETEMKQLRFVLGLDGDKLPASDGEVQAISKRVLATLMGQFGIKTQADLEKFATLLS